MTDLDLSSNNLNGSVSDRMSNLTNLQHLSMAQNLLAGPLPDTFFVFPALLSVYVYFLQRDFSFNNFDGTIPDSLLNSTHLEKIVLGFNSFSSLESTHLFFNPQLRYMFAFLISVTLNLMI